MKVKRSVLFAVLRQARRLAMDVELLNTDSAEVVMYQARVDAGRLIRSVRQLLSDIEQRGLFDEADAGDVVQGDRVVDNFGVIMPQLVCGDRVGVQRVPAHGDDLVTRRVGIVTRVNNGSTHPYDVLFDGECESTSLNAVYQFVKLPAE